MDAEELLIAKDGCAMSLLIADGLHNGVCENCPVCGCASLGECAGRIACFGYISGAARCVYKAKVSGRCGGVTGCGGDFLRFSISDT
jgi:hypothetical protein